MSFFVFFIQNAGSGALREMEAQRAGREEGGMLEMVAEKQSLNRS